LNPSGGRHRRKDDERRDGGRDCPRLQGCRRPPPDALRSGSPLSGEGIHGEAAVCGPRRGNPAAFTSPASNVPQCRGLSARATAMLAAGQAAERCRLPREPGSGAASVGISASRLLVRVSAHASKQLKDLSSMSAALDIPTVAARPRFASAVPRLGEDWASARSCQTNVRCTIDTTGFC
jgi:hypothetical protein